MVFGVYFSQLFPHFFQNKLRSDLVVLAIHGNLLYRPSVVGDDLRCVRVGDDLVEG